MSRTFTYTFAGNLGTLNVVTPDDAQQVIAGDSYAYTGFAITSISGTFNGQTVTGLFGTSGAYQSYGGSSPDNAIFVDSTQGFRGGSYDGIDNDGIDFTLANGNHVTLYQTGPGGTSLVYRPYNAQEKQVSSTAYATVTATNYASTVCYVTGTHIRIVHDGAEADVPVEDLHVGDLAVTATGQHRPIRWIGNRTVDCASHPDPLKAWPVRVAKDAFGPGRPARDLYVSPEHSLCVSVGEELLVPAFCLVNGSTIAYAPRESVTYWHVELDAHDLLLAESLPAESFLEMGENRRFFTGEAGVEALSAKVMARTHADFCRPFLMDGPAVDGARAQLAARAERLGWMPELDPGLVGEADGARLHPQIAGGEAFFAGHARAAPSLGRARSGGLRRTRPAPARPRDLRARPDRSRRRRPSARPRRTRAARMLPRRRAAREAALPLDQGRPRHPGGAAREPARPADDARQLRARHHPRLDRAGGDRRTRRLPAGAADRRLGRRSSFRLAARSGTFDERGE